MKLKSWQNLETTGTPDFSDGLQGENEIEKAKSHRRQREAEIIHPQLGLRKTELENSTQSLQWVWNLYHVPDLLALPLPKPKELS